MDDIYGKSRKRNLKAAAIVQPIIQYKAKITPLVIYGLGGVHTHTHISTIKGISRNQARASLGGACLVKKFIYVFYSTN